MGFKYGYYCTRGSHTEIETALAEETEEEPAEESGNGGDGGGKPPREESK